LKKRLEDLERMAASNSASPEQEHRTVNAQEGMPTDLAKDSGRGKRATPSKKSKPGKWRSSKASYSSPPAIGDEAMFPMQHTRQLSASPQPFASTPRSSSEALSMSPYSQLGGSLSSPYLSADYQPYISYPSSLEPSMQWQQEGTVPQSSNYGSMHSICPFSYNSMPSIDLPYDASGNDFLDPTLINVRPRLDASRRCWTAPVPHHRYDTGADRPS